jgi:hypothetical protein
VRQAEGGELAELVGPAQAGRITEYFSAHPEAV